MRAPLKWKQHCSDRAPPLPQHHAALAAPPPAFPASHLPCLLSTSSSSARPVGFFHFFLQNVSSPWAASPAITQLPYSSVLVLHSSPLETKRQQPSYTRTHVEELPNLRAANEGLLLLLLPKAKGSHPAVTGSRIQLPTASRARRPQDGMI